MGRKRKPSEIRPKPKPEAIERLIAEMRGAPVPERVPNEIGDQDGIRAWLQRSAEKELWFFSRWILGNDHLALGEFHRREVCPFLTDFSSSRFKLLMLPMGHLKTTVVSRSMPLHVLVQRAHSNIYVPGLKGAEMCTLLANENIQKAKENLDVLARHALENEWLYWLWPDVFWTTKKEAPRWNDEAFEVKRQRVRAEPSVKAIGMKTGFIGGYFDVIAPDDIAALQASQDPPVMERCKKFRRASMTRLYDKRRGIHIGIGTHWGADDVYVEWKKDHRVEVMIRSILEFDDESKTEKPLWPEKFPMDVIESMRKGMDPIEFALWYLNKPVAAGYTALRWEDLREYSMSPDGREIYFHQSEVDERINLRSQTISRNLGFVLGSAKYDPMNGTLRKKIPASMDGDWVDHMRLKNSRCEQCGVPRGVDGAYACEHAPTETRTGYRFLGQL